MKLATWNVALPVAATRRKAALEWIDRIAADVWVLTETHDHLALNYPSVVSSTAGRDGLHQAGHRWVAIWSRYRLEPLATSDERRTVACRLFPEKGRSLIVYGTVLPWVGSKWRNFPATGGVAYCEALQVQAADWHRLRTEYPDDELFVLGDFNQDLVTPRYYGSKTTKDALRTTLAASGLVAITAGDGDPIRKRSPPCACIDHICMSERSEWQPNEAERWPDLPTPQRRLSDHFGVAVSLVPIAEK